MRCADRCLPAASRPAAVISAFLLAFTPLLAARLPVRVYTTQDGLPRDFVSALALGPSGQLLIGTSGGVTRFDGQAFATWSEAEGLSGFVDGIHAEASGAIWAGGDFGLARLDPAGSDRFEPVPTATGMPHNVVGFFRDRQDRLWVGSSSGLHRVDDTDQGPRLGRPVPGIETEVDDIAQDAEGFLWIATHLELARVDPDRQQLVARFTSGVARNPHITTVMVDHKNRIWAGSKSGLCMLEASASPESPHPCERFYAMPGAFSSVWVTDLAQDPDGRVYAATVTGLSIGEEDASGNLAWRPLRVQESVRLHEINELLEDLDGNIWLGTKNSGLIKLVRGGCDTFGTSDGLRGYEIKSVMEDHSGELFLVGAGEGQWFIQKFDADKLIAVSPRLPASIDYLGWGWEQIALHDASGRWWMPSAQGALIYPPVKRLEELSRTPPEQIVTRRDGLPGDEVFRIFEDSRRQVWIGTLGAGGGNGFTICRRGNGSTVSCERIPGQTGEAPSTFGEDAQGGIWIGYYTGGLARYADGRLENLPRPEGLPVSFVSRIRFDRQGRLWVATRRGLARADDPARRPLAFRTYLQRDGLASSSIYSLAIDQAGLLWLGTSNGVTRLDPETGRTRRYTTADGLPASLINTMYCDRTGRLWFGTLDGLASMMPGRELRAPPPPALLEAIEVAGEPRRLPPLGLVHLDGLRLPAGQERLRIDFRSVNYRAGDSISFQYRLDESPEWSSASDQRSIIFDRLAPGRHRFEVRAMNLEGLMSLEPASVEFRVDPPFWRTWWFLALVTAAIASAAVMLHRQRVARLLALERVRTRIATDLHDEVGAGLSEIALMGELWAREQRSPAIEDGLPGRIAATSRRMVDSMSDIVWAINPEKDHVFNLSQRMRRFATTLLRSANVALRFDSVDESNTQALDGDARRELLLAFQEIVNNSVKHARCSAVEVSLRIEGADLVLQVSDNGCGFDPGQAEEGTGLSSMHQRAVRLGGSCLVDSRPGAGTRIIVRIPLQERGRRSRPLPPPPLGHEPAA